MISINRFQDYIFSLATLDDIIKLVQLNSRFQHACVSANLRNSGFLSVKFNFEDFETLIDHKEVIVVRCENVIVGYYLLNNFCQNSKFLEAKRIVQHIIQEKRITPESKIGLCAQVLIEREHQNRGLFRPMLIFLSQLLANKYDWLYSSISKQNLKSLYVHTKTGWTIVGENDRCYFILLNLKSSLSYG
jgi:hypothetical protein